MLINLNHKMTTHFAQAPRYTIQSLRVSPQNTGSQIIRDWQVIAPHAGALTSCKDGFDNTTLTLVIDRPHQQIDLIMKGKVETSDTGGAIRGVAEVFPSGFYLRETEHTQADRAVRVLARQVKMQDSPVEERVRALADIIHNVLDFQAPEAAHTAPRDAGNVLEQGAGCAVEITQVFLSAIRTIGIPARLVFGYLIEASSNPTATAGHPWVEVYDDGWKGFDVLHRRLINAHYVRVAMGLDYAMAAPLRGLRYGVDQEQISVKLS